MVTLDAALQRATWSALAPELAIEGDRTTTSATPAREDWIPQLRDEGYFACPDVVDGALARRLAASVIALRNNEIPPVFLWVYDEPWMVIESLDPMIRAALGSDYRTLPEIWTWFVPVGDANSGWRPHRDQPTRRLVDEDGTPHALTLWVALTEATILNGCMALVPSHLDPEFRSVVGVRDVVRRPQDVRALPIAAGGVLGWNHGVLHWGGRASRRAHGPRISIACEFQRGTLAPLATPLLPPRPRPAFAFRLWLVARAILGYRHMETPSPELLALARALQSALYPEVANSPPP